MSSRMHAPPEAYAVKASDMPQVADFFKAARSLRWATTARFGGAELFLAAS
jgi:hypothetical protein